MSNAFAQIDGLQPSFSNVHLTQLRFGSTLRVLTQVGGGGVVFEKIPQKRSVLKKASVFKVQLGHFKFQLGHFKVQFGHILLYI